MSYVVQQRDLEILKQSGFELFSKIELLNSNFKIIDSIEGVLISDSYSISATSDVRRTYNCEIFIKDSSFFIGSDKKIWLDKYIRPYIGIRHIRTDEIIYYLMGTYCLLDPSTTFDATTNNLKLSCGDLMCILNGDLKGHMTGLSTAINQGEIAQNVIVSLLKEAGITKYIINDVNFTLPYDLEYPANVTYYEIIKEITELYAGLEMFFDIDGTFVIQKIPTLASDRIVLGHNFLKPLLINEESSTTFTGIYNHITVWGQVIDVERFSTTSSYSNGIYSASFTDLTVLENFATYAVSINNSNGANAKLNINGIGAKTIMLDDNTPMTNGYISSGNYVFRYRKATDDFLLLGQYQVVGEAWDNNPDSPFNIVNLGYELPYTFEGGDYENIYTDELAAQRARYELYLATNMKNDISLEMINIPWLDVNWKISYQTQNSNVEIPYIIKSISGSTSNCQMSVEMIKFYPDYPQIT